MEKTASMPILQFEFEYDGYRVFLQVHGIFKHYYTEEMLRYCQFDYMNEYHNSVTYFSVLNEKRFQECYENRIEANENGVEKH